MLDFVDVQRLKNDSRSAAPHCTDGLDFGYEDIVYLVHEDGRRSE